MPLTAMFLVMLLLRSLGRRSLGRRPLGRRRYAPASVLLGVAALSVACTHAVGGANAGDYRLEVGLELPDAAGGGEVEPPVTVTVWVSNPGNTSVDFLLWNTPFEPTLSADVFDVLSGDARLPYQGRLIKRGEPPASAWISLSPGQRHEVQVDLGSVYDFSGAGTYVLKLAPTPQGGVQRFNPSAVVEVVTSPVHIEVTA